MSPSGQRLKTRRLRAVRTNRTCTGALEEFCKEALSRKRRVRQGKMPATQFTSWIIGREQLIREICTQ